MNILELLVLRLTPRFQDVYGELEAKVKEMVASGTLDEKRQIAYQSFLFIIMYVHSLVVLRAPPVFSHSNITRSHRASRIDQDTRMQRLRDFIDPVKQSWKTEPLQRSLENYGNFCELMAIDKAQQYM